MCELAPGDMLFTDLLRDPLTQLVMRSDGVTEQDMIILGKQVRSALAARDNTDRSGAATSACLGCSPAINAEC